MIIGLSIGDLSMGFTCGAGISSIISGIISNGLPNDTQNKIESHMNENILFIKHWHYVFIIIALVSILISFQSFFSLNVTKPRAFLFYISINFILSLIDFTVVSTVLFGFKKFNITTLQLLNDLNESNDNLMQTIVIIVDQTSYGIKQHMIMMVCLLISGGMMKLLLMPTAFCVLWPINMDTNNNSNSKLIYPSKSNRIRKITNDIKISEKNVELQETKSLNIKHNNKIPTIAASKNSIELNDDNIMLKNDNKLEMNSNVKGARRSEVKYPRPPPRKTKDNIESLSLCVEGKETKPLKSYIIDNDNKIKHKLPQLRKQYTVDVYEFPLPPEHNSSDPHTPTSEQRRPSHTIKKSISDSEVLYFNNCITPNSEGPKITGFIPYNNNNNNNRNSSLLEIPKIIPPPPDPPNINQDHARLSNSIKFFDETKDEME